MTNSIQSWINKPYPGSVQHVQHCPQKCEWITLNRPQEDKNPVLKRVHESMESNFEIVTRLWVPEKNENIQGLALAARLLPKEYV